MLHPFDLTSHPHCGPRILGMVLILTLLRTPHQALATKMFLRGLIVAPETTLLDAFYPLEPPFLPISAPCQPLPPPEAPRYAYLTWAGRSAKSRLPVTRIFSRAGWS